MPFIRCISSLGCPELSLEAMLALAARHGIGALELRALRGSAELPRQLAAEFGSPEKLAAWLRGLSVPVRIVALDTSLRLIGADAVARDAFLAFLPWAEALGGVRLRVFDGGRVGESGRLSEAADTVAWWRAQRAQNRWRSEMMIETHDALVTADALRRFYELAPDAAILWDAHHTWRRGGEDPALTWRTIGPRVCHVHVKDSVSVPSGRWPHTYVLPGRGEFPMAGVRRVLTDARFAGPVCLEWEKLWHPELAPLEDALAAAAAGSWW